MNPGPPACQAPFSDGLEQAQNPVPYVKLRDADIDMFVEFLKAGGYRPKTIERHRLNAQRILRYTRGYVTEEKLLKMLAKYREKYSEHHVVNITKTMKRLFRDFIKRPEIVERIKVSCPRTLPKLIKLPTSEDFRKIAEYLLTLQTAPLDMSLLLFYATTGLRRSEALQLKLSDVIWEYRAVVPRCDRRTKKAGITFFNPEAEAWLKYYIDTRESKTDLLFDVTGKHFQKLWRRIREHTGISVSPQILRKWQAVELRKRGVPDSFVDIFQGRAPRSVLARYYTPVGIEELKEVYDRAGLEIGVSLPH